MNFTPSVDPWVKLLTEVAAMDVDTVMPPHGDIASRSDVLDLATFITFEYAAVKSAIAQGVPVETAVKTVDLSPYKTWHNYGRREGDIRALYELNQTGRRSYFD